MTDEYWHKQCAAPEPHRAHLVQVARCEHDHNIWCWGEPEPDSVEAKVADLQPGQRVRVVFEGVVNEPTHYPADSGKRPAVTIGEGNGHVVLRYTGAHPVTEKEGAEVAGLVVPTLVNVEVVT